MYRWKCTGMLRSGRVITAIVTAHDKWDAAHLAFMSMGIMRLDGVQRQGNRLKGRDWQWQESYSHLPLQCG